MMPDYTRPGIYLEEVAHSPKPITAVPTSVVAFVGCTETGPVNKPVLIGSFTEYQRQFLRDRPDKHNQWDPMTLAVMAFYGNGGKDAYICRLPTADDDNDVTRLTAQDYSRFYKAVLASVADFSLLVLPGQHWQADPSAPDNAIIMLSLAFCQQQRHCLLLLELAAEQQLSSAANVTALRLPVSSFAALYYPWLSISNPLASGTLAVPPAAVAAGLFCRNDARYGVWKAPAGVSAKLMGITGLAFNVDDGIQQQLNPLGVNCIRTLPRVGTVIWGARTLAGKTDQEWRYISAKRTAIFIEQSITQSLHWAVFEPNDQPLWQAVRSSITNFMQTLFRSGALQGAKSSDAFFVRCGLGESMSQHDIDQQQLVIELGFALIKPAEFMLCRLVYKLSPP